MSEQPNFSSFTGYKQMVIELTGDLKKLKEYSEKLSLNGNVSSIDGVLKRLTEDNFSVAIIGEFKRGKSTLINALLGKDVLPMDVLPTTATLNKITYSITPFAKIAYKDGRTEEIAIDQLNAYVTKLTKESEERAKTIQEATVYYPVNYCKNGVTIIDTPGLNDDEAMTEVTMSVLPQIDAALMVIMAQAPFSESERDFLESKVITSDLGRVMFVVTGIDLLDEEDVDKVLNRVTSSIQEHVLSKAERTYGKDSKEYIAYKNKIGKVRVYGLSAKKALRAKLRGDHAMLEASCFPVFEEALERFLTEDRGAVMLNVPISRIKTSSLELVKAAQLRENALSMQKGEFDRKYQIAMEEIQRLRENTQRESLRINESAQRTFEQLQPMIRDFWPALERTAFEAVDAFGMDADDLKEANLPTTQERLTKAAKNAISKAAQEVTERIQDSINQALSNEAERLSGFENSFYQATERIQTMFVPSEEVNKSGDSVIGVIANSAIGYGIGGLYLGFKQAGWKGALLGGATGVAGMLAGNIGIFSLLLPALAIPVTWPVAIIGAVAVGLLSTFTSKWAVNKVFAKDRIEKFKTSFKDGISQELNKMRAEDNFTTEVWNQVDAAFDALKTKIRTETDNILNDTQAQLMQIKVEITQNAVASDQEKEELRLMLDTISIICARADDVSRQLAVVLAR